MRLRLAVLIVTLAAGLAAGLAFAWMVAPAPSGGVSPDALDRVDRLAYLALIGDLYALDGDLARARVRLAELGVDPDGAVLAGQLEWHLGAGGDPQEMRNLAMLARDLGAAGGVLEVFGEATRRPSVTAPIGVTAIAARTAVTATLPVSPTAAVETPAPAFRLIEQTARCGAAGRPGQIVIWVRDAQGAGLPGVAITAAWGAEQDRFYTGLRPERGPGYADFQMSPRVQYEVAVAGAASDVARALSADLTPGVCPTTTLFLDWQLTFEQEP